jgi:hypothetical protein
MKAEWQVFHDVGDLRDSATNMVATPVMKDA